MRYLFTNRHTHISEIAKEEKEGLKIDHISVEMITHFLWKP